MKEGQKIQLKVIASVPDEGQKGIEEIVGTIYEGKVIHESGLIQIESEIFGGKIVINPGEYKVL